MTAVGEAVSRAEPGASEASKPVARKLSLPFIGLIGSKTKWARFRHRLTEYGFDDQALGQVTCPIGLPDIAGKEPEVIAASVAAQLLTLRAA
jgi:xanthine dehydrogenase accessory factor